MGRWEWEVEENVFVSLFSGVVMLILIILVCGIIIFVICNFFSVLGLII